MLLLAAASEYLGALAGRLSGGLAAFTSVNSSGLLPAKNEIQNQETTTSGLV
jgi:hypothetical protein